MNREFRSRLKTSELLVGTIVTVPSTEGVEILVDTGFDWLFIDTEHGSFDAESAQQLLQAAGRNFPCVIRVPADDEIWIKKMLDIGATGVIVPQIRSAQQVEHVVSLCRFPPTGSRGMGISRANRYGGEFQDYVDHANQYICVIVQVEHVDAVDDIDTIVAVSGLDAVFIGPYDLSASLGKPGQVEDPQVQQAIERIREACLSAGVGLGIFGIDAAAVIPYVNRGFHLIAIGTDSVFLSRAAGDALFSLSMSQRAH